MNVTDPSESGQGSGSIASWLAEHDLLRGPFLFVDYWANVLRLEGAIPDEHVALGLVDRSLFRTGIDRPDLEVPRLRQYIWFFFFGPILLPFRAFRRLGRYRIRFRREAGADVIRALDPYRLQLEPRSTGRVDVVGAGRRLAENVVDPRSVAGFSSLFYAAYKLPMAAIAGAILTLLSIPALMQLGWIDEVSDHYLLIGLPVLAGVLWLLFRDAIAAVLGAAPVLIAAFLFSATRLDPAQDWTAYLQAVLAVVVLYLLIDWFFLPRPVPPVLMFYTRRGSGAPYRREGDEPYWLDGESYWVWRYLMLTPAELNKFWERDWERVELWIRADGDRAGRARVGGDGRSLPGALGAGVAPRVGRGHAGVLRRRRGGRGHRLGGRVAGRSGREPGLPYPVLPPRIVSARDRWHSRARRVVRASRIVAPGAKR